MRKTNQKAWDFAEDRAARFFEASRVKGSGIGFRKSDCRQVDLIGKTEVNREGGYRIECKSTERDKLIVQKSWFGKIAKEARDQNQIPALFFQFKDLTAFSLMPWPDGELPSVIRPFVGSSTQTTPEFFREIICSNAALAIERDTFVKAGCGEAWVFPLWKVVEVED